MNTTLKTKEEIAQYIEKCRTANFVHRADAAKNWDNYKALQYVLQNYPDRNLHILDAGGIQASAFLPTLQLFGYKRLIALDLSNPDPPKLADDIVYKRGDITQTTYQPNTFDVVACLSVIEHGVNIDLFFAEMSRIIKSNGCLVVSTDYWADKIENFDGRRAYGVPVFIFGRDDVQKMISVAAQHGFQISPAHETPDLECQDKTINWMGFQYTFLILCFKKV